NSTQITPSITRNIQSIQSITSILPTTAPSSDSDQNISQPTANITFVVTQNLVITITSISTVYPSIPAAHNPNLPAGSNNGGSSPDDGGNSSGLVIGVSLVATICLIGALTSFCYCYRRHRLLQYDDDGGEVVLRVDQDPFQSTLDQYHRNLLSISTDTSLEAMCENNSNVHIVW
ncbi:19129_t:CDS:2, partial [Racocetra persica]